MFIVVFNIVLFVVILVLLCIVLPRIIDNAARENLRELEERKQKYNF